MTDIPDDEVEAAAKRLELTHWNGHGCGTDPTSTGARSRCYGPSPADAREVAEEVLAAVRPRWEKQLAELRSENEQLRKKDYDWMLSQVTNVVAERDAARAELERVRAELDFAATLALDHGDCSECAEDFERCHETLRQLAALRPVPEQEQP